MSPRPYRKLTEKRRLEFLQWLGTNPMATVNDIIESGQRSVLSFYYNGRISDAKKDAYISLGKEERRQLKFEAQMQVLDPFDPLFKQYEEETFWEEIENNRLRAYLDHLLSQIPERERFVLEEHFYHGRTHSEISQDIQYINTEEGVGYIKERGLERLRNILKVGVKGK